MKNLTLFMQFFTRNPLYSSVFIFAFFAAIPKQAISLNFKPSNVSFLGENLTNIDSTKHGYQKAKLGMYFKKNWDFRNGLIALQSKFKTKETHQLILPKKIQHYSLVFQDSFNQLNSDIWSKGQPWGRLHPDNVHQFYGDPQAFVKDGCLHLLNEPKPYPIVLENQTASDVERMIKAQDLTNQIIPNLVKMGTVDREGNILQSTESVGNMALTMNNADTTAKQALIIPYSIGIVNTFHSQNFTYGFFAIRSKNPSGPATWPAWWLTGKNNWPPEIDIFEMYGGKTGKGVHTQTMTVHTGKVETHTKEMMMKKIRLSEDTDTAFHIYACLWTKNRIEFYTDNVRVKSIKLNRWMSQFYQEPMYLILNNALENKYIPQLISSGNKTSDFQVDWVQVYQSPHLAN